MAVPTHVHVIFVAPVDSLGTILTITKEGGFEANAPTFPRPVLRLTAAQSFGTFVVNANESSLFRVHIQGPKGGKVLFYSNGQLSTFNEADALVACRGAKLLLASTEGEEEAGAPVTAQGEAAPIHPDTLTILMRYHFKVPDACNGSGCVVKGVYHADTPGYDQFVQGYTIDNDTGHRSSWPLLSSTAACLPSNTRGYSMIVTGYSATKPLPASKWRFYLISSQAVVPSEG